jgi:Uma2 family endonuclease
MILPHDAYREALRERRKFGGDRYDEVWNGTYVMSPLADIEHQELATDLAAAIKQVLLIRPSRVIAGTNVSDRATHSRKNYRCPDVAVFLPGNPAEHRKSHWFGGPDFAVEIISKGDLSRKKFDFYAAVHVHELLVIDRDPWSLELYRRREAAWDLGGASTLANTLEFASSTLRINFRLLNVPAARPQIELSRSTDGFRVVI